MVPSPQKVLTVPVPVTGMEAVAVPEGAPDLEPLPEAEPDKEAADSD